MKRLFNQPISRRDFLWTASAGASALLGAPALAEDKIKPTADTLIVLWMAGGQASTETWDMKKYTPYVSGMEAKAVYSTFKAGDLGFILHSRHQYHWHTGYIPPQPVAAPHIGAVISKTLGTKHPDVPAFIDIGQRSAGGEDFEVKAFQTAGFLGTSHGPFLVPEPAEAVHTVRPPAGMSEKRFKERYELYVKALKA